MTSTTCLNCDKLLVDAFCSRCGQKADTHRITFKNFILHDLLHGTFHIERGILFTAKEALIRPGKAALDYISGKRKRYYNVFYLILITVGSIIFIAHLFDILETSLGRESAPNTPLLNEASIKLDKILAQSKLIICLFVPFGALNSYILFRRKRLNYTEHAIISGMILLGMLLISLLGNILFYANLIVEFNDTFASVFSYTITSLIVLHIGFGYYNAFRTDYSRMQMTYRIALFYVMLCFEIILLFWIAIGIVTDWQFYAVNIVGLFG